MFKLKSLFIILLLLLIPLTAHAELLWPLQVGTKYEYVQDPNPGTPWIWTMEVMEEVTINSQTYFRLVIWNEDDDGATSESFYWRSTDNELYQWCGTEELLLFKRSSETDYFACDHTTQNMPTESVTVPYGTFDAIPYKKWEPDEPENYWVDYIVPGLGFVKEVQGNSSDIDKLVQIYYPNSVPTVSEWGMIIFFILLVGSALWVIRRRTGQE